MGFNLQTMLALLDIAVSRSHEQRVVESEAFATQTI